MREGSPYLPPGWHSEHVCGFELLETSPVLKKIVAEGPYKIGTTV
jgi:hypothetical protein